MKKNILKPLMAILVLSTFVTNTIGQDVDMSRYIKFNVVSATGVKLKADTPDTPIKIVKGSGSSEDTFVGPDWINISFDEPNETVTIYGNISGFKTYMFPDSGIENIDANSCTGLTEFCCVNSHLTTLDVSNLTNLKQLDCSYNWLTSLNVNNLTNLEVLNCYSNRLTNIDISDLTALKRLACNDNLLTTLDASNSTNLTELFCYNNHINTINLNNLTSLIHLSCGDNNLTTIDVDDLTKLKKLSCYMNQLTELNVVNLIYLEELSCHSNQLEDIYKLNTLTNLTILECWHNNLTAIDISNLTKLEYLYCQENELNTLDVCNSPNLKALYCHSNKLNTLDISNSPNLSSLSCFENNFSTQVLDDIYCALPELEGKILPAFSANDENIDNVLATNAQNAIDKGWRVLYRIDNSDITTTGSYECTTDINPIQLESHAKVYPNPVSDYLYIETENAINSIKIFDVSGKMIISKSVNSLNNTSIDTSSLSSGTYLLQVYTDKGLDKHSFIKK